MNQSDSKQIKLTMLSTSFLISFFAVFAAVAASASFIADGKPQIITFVFIAISSALFVLSFWCASMAAFLKLMGGE